MNTPAHVVLNALALGRAGWKPHWGAVTAGALVPDLPMFVFYVYQRVWLGTGEHVIWSERYFAPDWQLFFDVFNSLPLIALAALVAWRVRAQAALAFFASMALHCLTDLPLHREDAHGHLFPLSSWRFESPVSYWDPAHHGLAFASFEALFVLAGGLLLTRYAPPRAWGVIGVSAAGLYLVFAVFAVAVWMS